MTELKAGRREWLGLASLAMPTLLLSIDTSVLYLALPHLSTDLGASSTQQLWIMDIYGFMIAGFLITMGTLGDRIGRRKLLLIGAAAFGAASVMAAFSTTAGMLIAARALMGVAGATLMPSTLALISNMFLNARQRATAISIWMSCFMVGMIAGPLIGGAMLEKFWWGSVFLLGVPVMVILLAIGSVILPEYQNPQAGQLDLLDVALSLAAILPFIYGFTEVAREGWLLVPLAAILVGGIFGVVFVYRQLKLKDPLLDLHLFKNHAFSATLILMLLTAVLMGGIGFFIAQFLQMVLGLSPLQAGLWMVPQSIGMIIGAMLTPVMAHRTRPAYVITGGFLLTTAGMILLTQVPVSGGLPFLITGFVFAAIGVTPIVVLGTDLVIGSAPPEKAGSAASMSETSNQLGIALGVAALGSIGIVIYRAQIVHHFPDGVPAATTKVAQESLVGALSVAGKIPGPSGSSLLLAAREAFTAGLHVATLIAALIFALLAVFAFISLRHIRPGSKAQQ